MVAVGSTAAAPEVRSPSSVRSSSGSPSRGA